MIYKRILLKLSGEAFAGELDRGIDRNTLLDIAKRIVKVFDEGIEIGIVVGGGNFWRGRDAQNFDRVIADSIGMMATVMNSLALQEAFLSLGIESEIMSAVEIPKLAHSISSVKARRFLESGKIVIFAGGTGSPFVSTDTAAAMRALEIKADALLKATLVDGVYDKDPHKYPDAVKYDFINYIKVIEDGLKVIDLPAVSLCRENSMPVHIFSLAKKGSILAILNGEPVGTIIGEEP